MTPAQFMISELIAGLALVFALLAIQRRLSPRQFAGLAPRLASAGVATLAVIAAMRFIVSM